jgi:hypothetical protein
MPLINHALAGNRGRPQITLAATARQVGVLIAHRRFIHLHVTALAQLLFEFVADGRKQAHTLSQPLHHLLAADEHAVPLPENLLLPVEGHMIAILDD